MIDRNLDPPDAELDAYDIDALLDLAAEADQVALELKLWSADLAQQAAALAKSIRRVAGAASHYEPDSKE